MMGMKGGPPSERVVQNTFYSWPEWLQEGPPFIPRQGEMDERHARFRFTPKTAPDGYSVRFSKQSLHFLKMGRQLEKKSPLNGQFQCDSTAFGD